MAVSALTLTGVVKVAEEASAAKKPYCACEDANDECSTEFAGKKARKKYIKQHPCAYKGECRGSGSGNPCDGAGVDITVNVNVLDLIGDICGDQDDCGGAGSGLECLGLICLPILGGSLGDDCASDDECATGRCQGGECVQCPGLDICGSDDDNAQCCVADATCIAGLCVLPIGSL